MRTIKIIPLTFCLLLLWAAGVSQTIYGDGYTDKNSYRDGDMMNVFFSGFFIQNTSSQISMIHGPNTTNFWGAITTSTSTINNPTPNNPFIDGFDYAINCSFPILPLNIMPSGLYKIETLSGDIRFVVKGNPNAVDVVIVYPMNTDNAYCGQAARAFMTHQAHPVALCLLTEHYQTW